MRQIIPNILRILNGREKVRLGALIALDLVIGLLDITFLGFTLLVINFYTRGSTPGPAVLKLTGGPGSLWLISVFVLLFGIKNFMGYRIAAKANTFFFDVASRLSRRNILQYMRGSYARFIDTDSSVQIRKISQQPIEFSNYILTNIQQVISQGILIVFTIVAILFYHPAIFFLLFLLLSPAVALLAWFIKQQLSNIRANTKLTSERTIQHLQESLSGFVEANLYDKDGFFVNRYFSYQQQLNKNIAKQQTLQGLPARLIEVFAILGFFILIVINKLSVDAPAINLFTIGVFMAAAYKIIPGIVKILNSTGQIKTYGFTINDLLAEDQAATRPQPIPIPIKSIKFERVSFRYKDQEVLNKLSFGLLPGDFAGISGESGRGKTTIVNLLLGFLEHDGGNIRINQKIAGSMERQQYWPQISYVKQQPFFVNDTILKNIILSDDNYDVGRLAKAISFCGLDRMLYLYPEGINKPITENGKNISGGQRQRIVLARALYHEFDLLILDEPFSEMDEQAEKAILSNLQALTATGKMVLFITHNKNSLSYCNKIITIDGE